jgi:hypothetical protein
MTKGKAGKGPLESLVFEVCHLNLAECTNAEEFKDTVKVMERNLEATLAALGRYVPPNAMITRAANNVKSKAIYLLDLCRVVSKASDDSEKWREKAVVIVANYEQFRISAGHFYRLAVPHSSFGVLKAAL